VTFASSLFALAFVPMLIEARLSARNERALRAAGAVEPGRDVYAAMQVAYPACFAAMVLEAWLRGRGLTVGAVSGAVIFASAKALKYWAIHTLGPRWTFRVLVPPHSDRTIAGPYRFLRHPNYVGVVGELGGFALLAGAPYSGLLSMAVFGALLLARIRVEERALGLRA
jgi:methyltransferase